ncbi:recombinase family protein [Streptomyces atratus]|uniref:recombinase family protein n=1 Tax=Streptomyces atratus TaxID=1893 RepID=UPI002255090A|nr:recombinase family protein [Streptomyces atratus]MCX5345004.1 recombinase family protein [Streptomyces atratus]
MSGKNAEREELWKALDYLRERDTLVVPSLDRLGRSILCTGTPGPPDCCPG